MSSIQSQLIKSPTNEEEDELLAMHLVSITALPLVLKAAVELDLLEIMAKAGPGSHFSPSDLASKLPTQNHDAPMLIDRMLRLLASYSILTCKPVADKDGRAQNLYGLAPVCKYLTKNEDGASFAPLMLSFKEKAITDCWCRFKDAVLEGGIPFVKEHGMPFFEYVGKDQRYHNLFNEAMHCHTTMTMRKVLETYKGFESLNEVVDVGGGLGGNLCLILSKYPQIKGINFDLPNVVKDAPYRLGVEHVGGDMFTKVPKGQAIFMKWVLHDWNDDDCLKLLKNCWDSLPESGKVIIVESIVPEFPESDILTRNVYNFDISMLGSTPGGKERTKKEFEALAKGAGFAASKIICRVYNYWLIEFHKSFSVST